MIHKHTKRERISRILELREMLLCSKLVSRLKPAAQSHVLGNTGLRIHHTGLRVAVHVKLFVIVNHSIDRAT